MINLTELQITLIVLVPRCITATKQLLGSGHHSTHISVKHSMSSCTVITLYLLYSLGRGEGATQPNIIIIVADDVGRKIIYVAHFSAFIVQKNNLEYKLRKQNIDT